MTFHRPEGLPDWTGETAVVLAGGPSLSDEQIAHVERAHADGRCKVIAVNKAYGIAPWADWLHAYDERFWAWFLKPQKDRKRRFPSVADFQGIKTTGCQPVPTTGAISIKMAPKLNGQARYNKPFADPMRPVHFYDSGYQAVQLAALVGAKRIIMLGFDAKATGHWHDGYPPRWGREKDYSPHKELHRTLAGILAEMGVEVINATPDSAIDAYPMAELGEVL